MEMRDPYAVSGLAVYTVGHEARQDVCPPLVPSEDIKVGYQQINLVSHFSLIGCSK